MQLLGDGNFFPLWVWNNIDGKETKPSLFLTPPTTPTPVFFFQGSWRAADLFSEFSNTGGSPAPDHFFVLVPWSMVNTETLGLDQRLQRRKPSAALGPQPSYWVQARTENNLLQAKQIPRQREGKHGNSTFCSRWPWTYHLAVHRLPTASSILPCLMWLLVLVHRLNFIPLNSSSLTKTKQWNGKKCNKNPFQKYRIKNEMQFFKPGTFSISVSRIFFFLYC